MRPLQFRHKLPGAAALFAAPLYLAASLAVAPPAAAAANDPSAAQKYEAEADDMIAKDDLKTAEIELKNAVKAAPEDGRLRLKLAKLEIQLNDIESAQVELKQARDHGADEDKVVTMLGRTYLLQGKFDELLQDFPVSNDATPAVRIATLVVRAEAQMQLKHVEDARSSLIAAEQIDPKSTQPKLGLARIAFTQNQFDDALKKADELVQIDPTADAHLLRGEILLRKNDSAGAMAEFDLALKAEPNNLGGYIERGQLYLASSNDAKAQADVKAGLAIAPRSVPLQYLQAMLLARAKDYAAADTILTKFASAFPSFPRGFYLQAVVKTQLKQYEQAESAITAYLGINPDDVGGQKVEAEIMLQKGNFAGAADILEKVTAAAPDDAQALAMLGQSYMQLRKTQQAVDAFDRALKLAPDNAVVLRGLALNHLAQGQGAQGTGELERALQLAPDDTSSAEALVLIYIRQKNYDKARKLAQDMSQRQPKEPVAANMFGMIELAQGHLPEAEAAYAAAVAQFPDFIQGKLQLASIYIAEGRRDQARDIYQAILDKDPVNLAALQNLGSLLAFQKQPGQVVDLWQKAHKAKVDDVPIAIGLIQAYIATKDFDTGLGLVRDMQVRLPNEPRLYAMRAELELQKNTPKDAVVSLQRLVELEPQDPAAHRDLALAYERSGDLPSAIAAIADARKDDPGNIGLAAEEVRLLGLRNPDDGIAAAQRLASEMPDQPQAQALEGDYLVSLKRPADSKAAYQRAFQAHPSLVLVERLVTSDIRDGKPAEAGKILNDWAVAHPDDIAARFALANFALGEKDWAAAKTRYEALLAKDRPDDPLILNNLAVIYQRENDIARALDYAQKAHAAAPQNPAIADTLGWVMVSRQDAPNALKYLQQAYDSSPDDLDIQYHLAFALDQTGKKGDAADMLKRAIATGREFDSRKDAEMLLDKLSKG
jgi:putative PEP-CTERM system TPR-repeat lipoprotein